MDNYYVNPPDSSSDTFFYEMLQKLQLRWKKTLILSGYWVHGSATVVDTVHKYNDKRVCEASVVYMWEYTAQMLLFQFNTNTTTLFIFIYSL